MMRFPTLLLAGIFLAAPALAGPILAPGEEDKDSQQVSLLDLGLEHLQAGELDRAENALRAHLRREAQSTEARMWLAEVLFRRDDVNGAGAQIKQVVALDPDYAPAHHALARFHYLKQDFDASELALKKTLELDPEFFSAHIDLADQYLMVRNDPGRAIGAYEKAIAVNPLHGGAYYGLGVARNRSGDLAGAEKAWRTASELAPGNPLPMFALGNMLMTQGETDAALEAFGAALEAEPRHLDSMLARGEIYATLGKDEAALAEFSNALGINSSYAPAHLKIALVHQRAGNDRGAIAAYRSVLAIDERQPLAHNNLAWLLLEQPGAADDALRHARRATELQPRVGAYWDTLGWIQHQLGDHAAALESLSKAVEISRSATAYEHLARVHSALGNGAAAAEAQRMARSLKRR